jgi:hypothetical protein
MSGAKGCLMLSVMPAGLEVEIQSVSCAGAAQPKDDPTGIDGIRTLRIGASSPHPSAPERSSRLRPTHAPSAFYAARA